jgi:hypothetical protein
MYSQDSKRAMMSRWHAGAEKNVRREVVYAVRVTWSLALRDGVDEADHASAAEELGDEDGGVALGFGGVDPEEGGAEDAGVAAALAQDAATIATHG